MKTRAAQRAPDASTLPPGDAVTTLATLRTSGWSDAAIRAHLDARRWQRRGRAVVLHNGPLHRDELSRVGLLNCGPRAALTSFTALELRGLRGWERDAVHVLVPGGARICRPPGVRLRIHWTGDWSRGSTFGGLHAVVPALVLAAASFREARPGCGILAAGVQQRLVNANDLAPAIGAAPRLHHRSVLLDAVRDIGQGAEALSEIDFARLCRRNGIPEPIRQAVRVEPSGRRRYLDAEWTRADGRRVVVEVDGALHLAPRRWWDDQLRQNELVITGSLILRFPSVIVRCEEQLVVKQLTRALRLS
jgi:hypothetical protein